LVRRAGFQSFKALLQRPVHWLPTFSQKARYANPASRRSEIEGWMAGIQQVRAWLDAAGRTEQLLVCG
jgi:hypothetical protein